VAGDRRSFSYIGLMPWHLVLRAFFFVSAVYLSPIFYTFNLKDISNSL
jgi:hypothetical protein